MTFKVQDWLFQRLRVVICQRDKYKVSTNVSG